MHPSQLSYIHVSREHLKWVTNSRQIRRWPVCNLPSLEVVSWDFFPEFLLTVSALSGPSPADQGWGAFESCGRLMGTQVRAWDSQKLAGPWPNITAKILNITNISGKEIWEVNIVVMWRMPASVYLKDNHWAWDYFLVSSRYLLAPDTERAELCQSLSSADRCLVSGHGTCFGTEQIFLDDIRMI